jgi:glycosyltransferase involved in cell wall biosynthesis
MLKHSSADYELVIATQTPLDFITKDSRLKINKDNIRNREDLYNDYDAMVLPRRYAGLCLPMNEALISGLPVFMTDILPNNQILPHNWLVSSNKIGEFKTKSMVDVYEANQEELAKSIDNYFNNINIYDSKQKAIEIGFNNFSVEVLKDKWLKVINE